MAKSMSISPTPDPKRIKEGCYLQYDGHIYRVIDKDDLKGHVASETDTNTKYFDILEVLKSESGYVLAASFSELKAKLEKIAAKSYLPLESAIPLRFLKKADEIIALVEGFTTYLACASEKQNGQLSKVQILVEYLSQPNISKSRRTYYDYKKVYDDAEGNFLRIASKLHSVKRRI